MARPRSDDKRQTILDAAALLFATEGLSAPTIRIAKTAGVSEGTIFTYFSTKDELMNQLYSTLKDQLHSALTPSEKGKDLKDQLWLAWLGYVTWGIEHPNEHSALVLLGGSAKITEATRSAANEAFCDVAQILALAAREGGLRHQPSDYVGALMVSMASTTMEFIVKDRKAKKSLCKDGFAAFWRAIGAA